MRFGLVANLKRTGAVDAINSIVAWAAGSSSSIILCDNLTAVAPPGVRCLERQAMVDEVDIVVSMGGDGTLLSAARSVGNSGKLLLGINLGSLGFLTQLTPQQLVPALDAVLAGKYQIEKRMLLAVEADGLDQAESCYALNDVVLDNGPISRLIEINLAVNGEDIVTYRADGLIIATPTGSTAYSLAVGGPIMHPRMEAVIAAPISSFSLNTRPMIFAPDDVIELRTGSDQAGLTLDGQVMLQVTPRSRVVIRRADFHARFVTFPENTFYRVLKSKLHWGVPPSNRN